MDDQDQFGGQDQGKQKISLLKKEVTQKTEGRQSFCLAVGEVQKVGDTEHHTIIKTFSQSERLYMYTLMLPEFLISYTCISLTVFPFKSNK